MRKRKRERVKERVKDRDRYGWAETGSVVRIETETDREGNSNSVFLSAMFAVPDGINLISLLL